uniref:Uncharacterized protein n=1 Tax=uncultured gamma proteobacterium HF0070_08D07 TaxID=710983 RepID=E0XRY5_9GAMM|nr:hypothetical protein [uncultured gamma proteobacterium HF0070_08D07]
MPPTFNLSHDQTLQFNRFELFRHRRIQALIFCSNESRVPTRMVCLTVPRLSALNSICFLLF